MQTKNTQVVNHQKNISQIRLSRLIDDYNYNFSQVGYMGPLDASFHNLINGLIYEILLASIEIDNLKKANGGKKMDKEIREIEKGVKKISKEPKKKVKKEAVKVEKQLKSLEKADKKRDPACDMGKKMMKKKEAKR